MTIVRNVFILSMVLVSFGLIGCSSESEPEATEPGLSGDIEEPEQVSFADWERPENCELGTMPVIGEAECQAVGSACPAGDWPAAIPEADQVIYVQPGAEGDGTSKTSAIGKISDAVELAEDGAVIVLSKGVHEDNVVIGKSMTLIGACPTETILEGKVSMGTNISETLPSETHEPFNDQGDAIAVVFVRGSGLVTLQDFMVTGVNVGVLAESSESLTVQIKKILFNSLQDTALLMSGDQVDLHAESISITDTNVRPSDQDQGKAIRIWNGKASFNRMHLARNHFGGVTCDSGPESPIALVDVTNAVVHDTMVSPDGARFPGIQGYGFSSWKCDLSIEKALITDNSYYGIGMLNEHTEQTILTVTDTIITNTKAVNALRTSEAFPWVDTELGIGMLLWGGDAYVNRVLLENNATAGIVTMESAFPCNVETMGSCENTYAVLENIDIRNMQMDTTGHFGVGIAIMDGAETLISKTKIEKAHTAGVFVTDSMRRNGSGDTIAFMTDIQIGKVSASDVADDSESNETFGDGVVIARGALSSINRFKVSEVERVGVLLNGKYDWQEIENTFGKRDLVSKQAVERSKRDKQGKRDSVLSFGSVENAKIGINNQMTSDELGKRDSVEELTNDVTTSEVESSYSTDAIAIPAFSVLNKAFMEAVFGAQLDAQAQ